MKTSYYLVRIDLVDEEECYGIDQWTERVDEPPTFLQLQREYGRCTSKVYIDLTGAPATPIGWCFEKRIHCWETGESRLQSAWVTIEHHTLEVTYG